MPRGHFLPRLCSPDAPLKLVAALVMFLAKFSLGLIKTRGTRSQADLSGLELFGASFGGCNLTSALLRRANLRDSDFRLVR